MRVVQFRYTFQAVITNLDSHGDEFSDTQIRVLDQLLASLEQKAGETMRAHILDSSKALVENKDVLNLATVITKLEMTASSLSALSTTATKLLLFESRSG